MRVSLLKGWKEITELVEQVTGIEFTIESARGYVRDSRPDRLPLVGRFGRRPIADRAAVEQWAKRRFSAVATH